MHSKAKHIVIIYHFIRDHVNNGDISIEFINSKHQLENIFTKPLDKVAFEFIRNELGIAIHLSEFLV